MALGVANSHRAVGRNKGYQEQFRTDIQSQGHSAHQEGAWGAGRLQINPTIQAYPFCGTHIPPSCPLMAPGTRLTLSGASSWTAWPHWGKTCIWNFPGEETSRQHQGQKGLPSSSLHPTGHWAAQEDLPQDSPTM